PALAAIYRDTADPERILPEERRIDQLALHDEFRPRQGIENHDNIEKALMFGGDNHRILRHLATDLGADATENPRRHNHPAGVEMAGGIGPFARDQRPWG